MKTPVDSVKVYAHGRSALTFARKMKTKSILGIIATLLGAVFVFLSIAQSHSKREKSLRIHTSQTKGRLNQLYRSLEEFKQDTGFFPHELTDLLSNHGIENWNGPYYNRKVLHPDSWGKAFHYEIIDGQPFLSSAGRDGKLGTDDDIKLEK